MKTADPREAYRKHVATLRALGVPRPEAKRAARELIAQTRLIERAVGKRLQPQFRAAESRGGWILEIFIPREGLSPEQCALVEGLGGSSAARMLGRLI